MKNLTWQNPEQLFVAQELINKVKSKCCGIKGDNVGTMLMDNKLYLAFDEIMLYIATTKNELKKYGIKKINESVK